MNVLFFVIILFSILGFVLCNEEHVKKEKAYLMICFVVMILLRSFFNPDYSDNYFYNIGFSEYRTMSFMDVLEDNAPSLKAETGYRVFCKLLTYVTSEWGVCYFFISFIIFGSYYMTVKRYSTMYWLSVLLIMTGPFIQSLFVLRQYMALGMILLSYPFILEKRIIPYLLLCFIAISFHQTAAVFLPTYFLYNMRRTKTVYEVLFLLFIVLYYCFSFFLELAASFAIETASYNDDLIEYNSEEGTNNKMALLLVTMLLLRIRIMKEEFFKEGINKLLSLIMIMGTLISVVGIGFIATGRLNMFYAGIEFLYVPNTFQYVLKKQHRTIMGIGYFIFMLYFMIKNSHDESFSEFWFFTE